MNTYGNTPVSELSIEALRELADELKIKYHPSSGEAKLIAKIEAIDIPEDMTYEEFIELSAVAAEAEPEVSEVKAPEAVKETPGQRKQRLKREAAALVRIRISCMNPAKREWEGEIFTVSNSVVGTFRKYVPFETEWHVPQIIFNMIKAKQYQQFYTVTGPRGEKSRKGKLVKEYAVEVLPPLTEEERQELARQQALAGGVEA